MGSFDGWTEGEEMSPEYSGDYAIFSATLKLRPGRYMIPSFPLEQIFSGMMIIFTPFFFV